MKQIKRPNLKNMINEAFEGVTPYGGNRSKQRAISEDELALFGLIEDKTSLTEEYVESMGPDFDHGLDLIVDAWINWKKGPLTEPHMVKPAQKEVLNYIQSYLKKKVK